MKNKWYCSYQMHDEKTDLHAQISERDKYWSWEIFDWYGICQTGQAPTKNSAIEATQNYIKGVL